MTLYFLNKVKFKNSELDLFDCGHNWYAKINDLIQKLESFTNQTLCFIEYQIKYKNLYLALIHYERIQSNRS